MVLSEVMILSLIWSSVESSSISRGSWFELIEVIYFALLETFQALEVPLNECAEGPIPR
ncbi:hypothetical protein D3C71_1368190 [compost metagenome]